MYRQESNDSLVEAIYYFSNHRKIELATVLMKKYIRRESMRMGVPDLDEEGQLPEEEFNNWISKHFFI